MGAAKFTKILVLIDTAVHSIPRPLCPLRRLGVLSGKKTARHIGQFFTKKAAMLALKFWFKAL